jgi:hypothetical protein
MGQIWALAASQAKGRPSGAASALELEDEPSDAAQPANIRTETRARNAVRTMAHQSPAIDAAQAPGK